MDSQLVSSMLISVSIRIWGGVCSVMHYAWFGYSVGLSVLSVCASDNPDLWIACFPFSAYLVAIKGMMYLLLQQMEQACSTETHFLTDDSMIQTVYVFDTRLYGIYGLHTDSVHSSYFYDPLRSSL